MTIQGAVNELINLLNADDIPIYYKGGIKKVIETIDDYVNEKDDYVKRKIKQTEPQTDKGGCSSCAGKDICANAFTEVSQYCGAYEPLTERSE